jgi:hypothetical protein
VLIREIDIIRVSHGHTPESGLAPLAVLGDFPHHVCGETQVEQFRLKSCPFEWLKEIVQSDRPDGGLDLIGIDKRYQIGQNDYL